MAPLCEVGDVVPVIENRQWRRRECLKRQFIPPRFKKAILPPARQFFVAPVFENLAYAVVYISLLYTIDGDSGGVVAGGDRFSI